MTGKLIHTIFFVMIAAIAWSQQPAGVWHGKEREMNYQPSGSWNHPHGNNIPGFEIVNGKRRFNRALYGTNSAFRVEAGDLPEFAMYMPGMGGNLKFGLITETGSKWLIDAKYIKAIYRPGAMTYTIQDPEFDGMIIHLWVHALSNGEGMFIEADFTNVKKPASFLWAYGGATGRRFSRDGDIGADPESSFYLQPEYCRGNQFEIKGKSFQLKYGTGNDSMKKSISGMVPFHSDIKIADAASQQSPLALYNSTASATPVIMGKLRVSDQSNALFLLEPGNGRGLSDLQFPAEIANDGWQSSRALSEKVIIKTPDPYLDALGGALYAAADAIYESPSYLHGAVAWRMRLPAWRGAYVADPLGWHDRARSHFRSYALSQVKDPETAPVVMDTALHLARHLEKIGTGMFTSGYICRNPNGDIRPHHYDMNLVFIDQLLNHFNWTGDTAFVAEMWPVIERHLAWEKRNFDADGDGLYDAYCCIWASDALQYSGGGVTHSSAYNYRAFKTAAELATLIGRDGRAYKSESEKILIAINKQLWLPQLGWYAEYKDLLGKKLIHPVPGLWTIYHALDSKIPDAFQAYQSTRFVDTEIPHIPVRAKGLADTGLYLLSTSNWQPYTWSINNVGLAENLHASLAYWQANRPDEAFLLWKSALVESMFLGASPGGFQQLSFYDAIRGQLYRDFADPVGMAARTLVEGLFGIQPDALHDTLAIRPGFPATWNAASIKLPDIDFSFGRIKNTETYYIRQRFAKKMNTKLVLRATYTGIRSVTVNKKPATWRVLENAVGYPAIEIEAGKDSAYQIVIRWKGEQPIQLSYNDIIAAGEKFYLSSGTASFSDLYDPQNILGEKIFTKQTVQGRISTGPGNKTIFVRLQQGNFTWWQPAGLKVVEPVELAVNGNFVTTKNNASPVAGELSIGSMKSRQEIFGRMSATIDMTAELLKPGTNRVKFETASKTYSADILNWRVSALPGTKFEKIDLSNFFNEKVTNIFKQNYLSPRPTSPTLQLPTQGIGNWCYPLTTAEISDSGLRAQAKLNNEIRLPQGIPFSTPGDTNRNNIVFTSQWDNFPDSVIIPLSGRAQHLYLLMAGTTNPMQSRITNGEIRLLYQDGSADTLSLKNPVNWWPIEQDYLDDGYAFTTDGYKPLRYYLKKGIASTSWNEYTTIRGFSNRGIDGGAATVLDLPLNAGKELKSIVIHTLANDVVIGLMGLTLVR